MADWTTSMQRGLLAGTASSVVSTAALALLGRTEAGSAYAPTNAVSHWIWGDEAAEHDGFSLKYTITGYLIHHASATFWSVLLEKLAGEKLDRKDLRVTLAASAATSALACFTDYKLTPKRLHPGYEKRLSKKSLAGVYAAFAVGLALGAIALRRD
jgi:predicted aconitase